MTNREEKLKFLKDHSYLPLNHHVSMAIGAKGVDWLTDEQIDDLVLREIDHQNMMQRMRKTLGAEENR